ncbi:serine/threonine-protein kinase [Ktedonobacteria bacterium brp13]|nr:serine/threonine-protein kinase [Ktedonobacteria bacterium brp13]
MKHMSNNHSSDAASYGDVPESTPTPLQMQDSEPKRENQSTPPSSVTVPPVGWSTSERGTSGTPGRLAPGTTLSNGRFQIEQLIAAGGMGAVYKALDLNFKRPCAVKEMLDGFRSEAEHARAIEWFTREAGLLLDLNHSCIPRVRDFFAENNRHYLVMDLINGRTLSELLAQGGLVVGMNGATGITEMRARLWMRQLCNVLDYLHRQTPPIIFRDLKPSNVMVTAKDEIKLIDFGIARQFQEQQQATVVMTLGFAPPEQLHGRAEPRSDLYSLGATIFRVLTQRDASHNHPNVFSFPPVRTLRPDISPGFEMFLQRALEPDINLRWRSAAEMEHVLLNLPAPSIDVTATYILTPPTIVEAVTPPALGLGSQPQVQVQISTNPSSGNAGSGPISHASGVSGTNSNPATGLAARFIADARRFIAEHKIELAYEAITRAHTLEPQNAFVHQIFGQVFAHRKPPQTDLALNAYEYSLQLQPNDGMIQAGTQRLIGDVWYFLRANPAMAIPAYSQSVLLHSKQCETYELLGQCYEKTNNLLQAVESYREATNLALMYPEVVRLRLNFQLGLLAWRTNQSGIAEQAFTQVLVLNAADHQARYLLSQVYERAGKLEDAWRECNYIMNGPLRSNPGVQQQYFRLKQLLGR